jgi:hypothetical protein
LGNESGASANAIALRIDEQLAIFLQERSGRETIEQIEHRFAGTA